MFQRARACERMMSRYFFDINDGDGVERDEVGLEIGDLAGAQAQAVEVLPEIAREVLPDGTVREISVLLRSATGQSLFRATLTLRCISMIGSDGHPLAA